MKATIMLRVATLTVLVGLLAGCAVYSEPRYYRRPPGVTYIVPAPVPAPGYYYYPRHGRSYGRGDDWHRGRR